MASRGLESRIRRLEARHASSRRRGGVVEVPCAPGEDILEQAESRGLLNGLSGNVALVPAPVPPEEWDSYIEAELKYIEQRRADSAETERPQNSHGK